jgi:hypothetical protein
MTVMMDILGAGIIAGIMLLTIFSLVGTMNQAHFEKTMSTNIQADVINFARIIESDFLKIGYHTKSDAIQYADSQSIQFKSDLLNNNNVVSVRYSLGGPNNTTLNPNDLYILREVSNQNPINAGIGLTTFQLTYFDTLGRILSLPIATKIRLDSIQSIQIKIRLESAEPVINPGSESASYQSVYWSKTIHPRNL